MIQRIQRIHRAHRAHRSPRHAALPAAALVLAGGLMVGTVAPAAALPTASPMATPSACPTATPSPAPAPSDTPSAPAVTATVEGLPAAVRLTIELVAVPAGSSVEVVRDGSPMTLFGHDSWATAGGGTPTEGTPTERMVFTIAPVAPGYAPTLAARVTFPDGTTLESAPARAAALGPPVKVTATGLAYGVRLVARLAGVPAGSSLEILTEAGRPVALYGQARWPGAGDAALTFTVAPVAAGYAPPLRVRLTLPDGQTYTTPAVRAAALHDADTRRALAGGGGKRIVWSKRANRVWLIDAGNRIMRTFPVTDRDANTPVGTYRVVSRSTVSTSYENGRLWYLDHMIRFYKRPGASLWIGFHAVPHDSRGRLIQPLSSVGQPGYSSAGCVRSRPADQTVLWGFGPVGTLVRVIA